MDYTHDYYYESLAEGIVAEACKFFRSKYFGIICDLDPDILMNRITEAYV